MKYFEVSFSVEPFVETACDLVAALAGEVGFESFEDCADGVKGYVQQQLFDEQALQQVLADFPLPDVTIGYTVREAADRDWNEAWEQQGFEPVVVNGDIVANGEGWGGAVISLPCIVIHDGRHLPAELADVADGDIMQGGPVPVLEDGPVASSALIPIEIDARQAFGTGTHETTRMVCASLIALSPVGFRVLDCGTGTGILSICALKLGAAEAVGYDIDEWSVDNARHNAVINGVDDRFTPLLGDATVLDDVEGLYDVVVANINRNILLHDMPQYFRKMAPGARLVLSGFYTADVPLLCNRAAELGLKKIAERQENGWACLVFSNGL